MKNHGSDPDTEVFPRQETGDEAATGKVLFTKRLGRDWTQLADLLGIRTDEQQRFVRGEEARGIWGWLESRDSLARLPATLHRIGRSDLAKELSALELPTSVFKSSPGGKSESRITVQVHTQGPSTVTFTVHNPEI